MPANDRRQHELAGGDYVFEVTATNNDGVWCDEITELKITIVPPFWKTTWFYSLLILSWTWLYSFLSTVNMYTRKKMQIWSEVKERTAEIEQQKVKLELLSDLLVRNNEELSKSNRLIRDSIRYAKRIQDANIAAYNVASRLYSKCIWFV
jgi:hypothetical protein